MVENVKVEPAPMQRTRRDVAVELIKLYLDQSVKLGKEVSADEMAVMYEKFYDVANKCDGK